VLEIDVLVSPHADSNVGFQEKVVIARSPVADLKALKNEVEIEGFRQCHIRDGAALVSFVVSFSQTDVRNIVSL
jgi:Xaa-Pro aminopeptidase